MGATHLVITLANYSATEKRRKTAVIELSGNHAIEELIMQTEPFELAGVTYYPNWRMRNVPQILNLGYEVIIFDMGSVYYQIRMEFLRCRQKLVVGSLAPWRKQEYYRFIRDEMGDDVAAATIVFLANNGMIKKDKKDFKNTIGAPVYAIPNVPDAFHPEKSSYQFLDRFL